MEYKYIFKLLNLKLDWDLLLNHKIYDLLYNLTFDELILLFKTYKPTDINLHMIISNPNLKEDERIKLLDLFPNELNIRDEEDQTIIFPALHTKKLKLVKYIISKDVDINYYTFFNTFNPLKTAHFINFIPAYELIWKHIKDKFNYTLTNRKLQNIAHYLLSNFNDITNKTTIDILQNCPSSVWNQISVDKITPFELLIEYNFEKYSFLLKNKQININNIKKENITKDTIPNTQKWLAFLKTLPPYIETTNVTLLDNYKYAHYNLFQAYFTDITFYTLYLKEKYKNLYFPNFIDFQINIVNTEDIIKLIWPDSLLQSNPIFPWFICYQSEDDYWIHSNLNNLINAQRLKKKYDFAFCYLSLRSLENNMLHANIIIYDFNNLIISRFDPYGDTTSYDKNLDDILEEELTWNTGFTYYNPSKYMPVAGFQSVSDEVNPLIQKTGDFGGYCLAWCIWFLEHRIINKHISLNELVDKLLKKIANGDNTFMEYIRNYANKINETRVKYLTHAGIDPKTISNTNYSHNTQNAVSNFIINAFTNNKIK